MTTHLPTIAPGDPASLLNADRRRRDLDRCADSRVDVAVIGGGITGVGVALDAATRGLTVALVEAHDLAYGTSRWSSKLVHGGLRYLAGGQVGVAWESAAERARIMGAIAPHLTHPLAQAVPITDDVSPALVRAGLYAGDAMRRLTGAHLPRPRRYDRDEALALVPGMTSRAEGALVSWDGQLLDDARLVVTVARTAAAYGARILTHTQVTDITDDGLAVRDELTGEAWQLRATRVVNATGAWAAEIDPRVTLVRSRGSHLVVPSEVLGNPTGALMTPVEDSTSRFVFTLPQPDGITYVGLTDVETEAPLDAPAADSDEIEFLLRNINRALERPLTRDDIISTYSGYRPLLAAGEGSSADLSRRHAVLDGPMVSIVGGKLTTYRRMAADAVDLLTDRPCRTEDLPLVGAAPWCGDEGRLRLRFGAEAGVVADLGRGDPSALAPLPGSPVLPVELTWAVHAEGAMTDEDILDRRLRLDLVPRWREAVAGAWSGHESRVPRAS